MESAFEINRVNPLGTSLILNDFFCGNMMLKVWLDRFFECYPKKQPERAPSALLRSEKEKDIEREDPGPAISAKLVQFLAMLVREFLDFDP